MIKILNVKYVIFWKKVLNLEELLTKSICNTNTGLKGPYPIPHPMF